MKEGYLQLKIAELNDKCTKIEERLNFENNQLDLLDEKIGQYKEVIKKFKDLEQFKTRSLKDITAENRKLLDSHVEQVSDRLTKELNTLVSDKSNKLNETLSELQEQRKESAKLTADIKDYTQQVTYLLEYIDILTMKLVNKDILSGQDVAELERRANKKAGIK